MKYKALLVALVALVLALGTNALALEKGTGTWLEDSTGTATWTVVEDTDVDSSTILDCSTFSSFAVQTKWAGNCTDLLPAAARDSNDVTVAFLVTTVASPTVNDWTQIDSLVITHADTTWHYKEIDLSGARKIMAIAHATAAAKIDSTGAVGYMRYCWTRNMVQKGL